jgi:CheY-like chemotaxis protein
LLIVEDDVHYARLICDLSRDKGFKVLHAATGTEALRWPGVPPDGHFTGCFPARHAGLDGLNHLKQDPSTRHIPVQMLTSDEDWHHGLSRGAFAFVTKPTTTEGLNAAITRIKAYATPRRKRLLVVEDERSQQVSIEALLGYDDIDVAFADTGADALAAVTGMKHTTAWFSTCGCPT